MLLETVEQDLSAHDLGVGRGRAGCWVNISPSRHSRALNCLLSLLSIADTEDNNDNAECYNMWH